MPALGFLDEAGDKSADEVLNASLCVTGCGLDLEDTFLDRQARDIKSPSTKVEDQDVTLGRSLLIEIICDSGHNQVIEVRGNGDDGL